MIRIRKLADEYMLKLCEENPDPSHDILHVRRVVKTAELLCKAEGGDLSVVLPAAYLHDCVYISKTDIRRSKASTLSADKAVYLMRSWGVHKEKLLREIYHAVRAHSFSAGVTAQTLEAKIVQDADRLDAMGAIGLARTLAFGGVSIRPIYNEIDPFCHVRNPDDRTNTLDHFFTKLLRLQERLNTASAKVEGEKRLGVLKEYLIALERELVN